MKNETLKTIFSRFSCRTYTTDPVADEDLNTILQAGLYAASGMNKQPAVLVAVTKKDVRNKLSKMNADVMNSSSDPFYGAQTVIAVLADSSSNTYIEDGALAIGNMLMAAASLGLGSCWIHRAGELFDSPEGKQLKKEWGLSDEYKGIGFCIVGHPAEPEKHAERKNNRIIRIK